MKKNNLVASFILLIAIFLFPRLAYGDVETPYGKIFTEISNIQPVIMVPYNYQSGVTDTVLDKYKIDVKNALDEVKSYYARNLNGKTFEYSQDVLVLKSTRSISKTNTVRVSDLFRQMAGYANFKTPGTLYIIWILGSSNNIMSQTDGFENTGYIFLNHRNLLELGGGSGRDRGLASVGHELGHGFGLVYSTHAYGHPCSELSAEDECVDKNGLYPPSNEWLETLMGYNGLGLSQRKLNNSVINPEKCKLFSNSYLNDNTGNCPFPVLDTANLVPEAMALLDMVPNTVQEGQEFILKGRGFGNVSGDLKFYFYNNHTVEEGAGSPEPNFRILSWSDTEIKVVIDQALSLESLWYPRVTNRDTSSRYYNQSTESQRRFTILGNSFGRPLVIVTARFFCEGNVMKRQSFYIERRLTAGSTLIRQSFNRKDPNGIVMFLLDYSDLQAGDEYFLRAYRIDEISASDGTHLVIDQYPSENINKTFDINYPQCPAGVNDIQTKEPLMMYVNGEPWENFIEGELELDLRALGVNENEAKSVGIRLTIAYSDGTSKEIPINFAYDPQGSPGIGRACIYTEDNVCRQGNCLDGSQSCGFNDNCGYVEGVSSGEQVSCPGNTSPTPTPNPSPSDEACNEESGVYTQCGGSCNGRFYASNHTVRVVKTVDSSCDVSFSCTDQGAKEGECGNPNCNEDTTYCDGRDTIHKHSGYLDSSGDCEYAFDNLGPKEGKCGNPSCNDDFTYCDNGREIHKYGGHLDTNTGECEYAYDDIGEC